MYEEKVDTPCCANPSVNEQPCGVVNDFSKYHFEHESIEIYRSLNTLKREFGVRVLEALMNEIKVALPEYKDEIKMLVSKW